MRTAGHHHPATFAGRILLLLTVVRVSAKDSGVDSGGEPPLRLCVRNTECNTAAGEVCWWYYAGCPRGQCMCDPRGRFRDASGRCRTMKIGNEPCEPKYDKCPDGMICARGRCQCNSGTMTKDHAFCLKFNERLLGETCNPKRDTCYQTSARGYSPTEVTCTKHGECACREGYKETGNSCIRWSIGEKGCLKNYQCQGGALCIDGYCRCPAGYEPGAGNSKCVRQGAVFDLVLTTCDEINEKRYCAKDYICHRCAGQHNYTCVKFKETQLRRYVSSSQGLHVNLSIQLSIVFHILIVFTFCIWKNR